MDHPPTPKYPARPPFQNPYVYHRGSVLASCRFQNHALCLISPSHSPFALDFSTACTLQQRGSKIGGVLIVLSLTSFSTFNYPSVAFAGSTFIFSLLFSRCRHSNPASLQNHAFPSFLFGPFFRAGRASRLPDKQLLSQTSTARNRL